MKLKDVYKTVVDFGIKKDPRPRSKIQRLSHPYPDTRILSGDPDLEVRTMLVGIDIEVGEVLLADRLRSAGERIDLLFSHHPEGMALANFFNVMDMQVDILSKLGVSASVAKALLSERKKEVERKIMPVNHSRAVDAARLLDIAFMNCHTPSDNCVMRYLQDLLNKKRPPTLGAILDILKNIPEYRDSAQHNVPPKIIKGNPSSRAGKIFVDMTGGTEGSKKVFSRLSQAGISTIIAMHLSEQHFKKAQEQHMNIIIAGHIASDNLGLNLMLDELEKKDTFKILECSGFRRFSRI